MLCCNTLEIVLSRKEEQKPLNFSDNSIVFCNLSVHNYIFFKEENVLDYIYFII